MKKEKLKEKLNKIRSWRKAPCARYILRALGALVLYGALTVRVNELTLISGQEVRTGPASGICVRHNEEISDLADGVLTAGEAGSDRFLVLAPGRTECFFLDVIDRYVPESTWIEGRIGDTLQLEKYKDLENTFESRNDFGVAADESGVLHLKNAGSFVVVQTINGFQKVYYTVVVKDPELVLQPEVIYEGETAVASLENYNGLDTDADYTAGSDAVSLREGHIPLSFRDLALKTGLDPAGARITGKKPGEALIRARIGGTQMQSTLKVSELPYIKEENTLLIGDKKKLEIANVIDAVTYESSDEKVVQVKDGLLVPVDSGRCTITARVRSKECSMEFDIPEPEIVCSEPEILAGSEVKFTINGFSGSAVWTSSDPEILSMEEDGTAKGVSPGKCEVTAHTELYDFTCETEVSRDFYGRDKIPDDLPDSVKALLSCVFYYEDRLQEDIEKGRKWQYSNHGWANNYFKMFDVIDSGKDGYRSCNCDSGPQWIVQDIEGSKSYKGIAEFYSGGPSMKSLMNAGKVEPGDIFMGYRIDSETGKKIGHTWVYLGEDMTFDTGHGSGGWHADGSISHTDPRKAVFETWIHPTKTSFTYTGYTVTRQVRLKGSYVPKRYRNSEGELTAW